jgi:phosphatidylglycerophosphate synthase
MVAAADGEVAAGLPRPVVLIEAGPTSRLRVFGMTLLERAVRTLAQAGVEPAAIRVRHSEPERAAALLPEDLRATPGLRFEAAKGALAERLDELRREAPVIAIDGDAVLDARLVAFVAGCEGSVATVAGEGPAATAVLRLEAAPVAAFGSEAGPEEDTLAGLARAAARRGRARALPLSEVPDYLPKLRRHLPAYAFRVRDAAERDRAERQLFAWNYKGSTDFFTAHVYPPLVWVLVRALARRRVDPNVVSWLNVALALGAVPLFAAAAWVPGLLMAWTMSVLDSVDGKLARLTFRASKLGHVLDHGLDVVHPPLWYLAWAWPLAAGAARGPLLTAAWVLVGAYVLDRLVTEAFTRLSPSRVQGGASIHAWRPLDVRVRTWVSRRNINLPIFTVGLAVGAPVPALLLVVAWQVATLLFHATRLGQLWRTAPAVAARAGTDG